MPGGSSSDLVRPRLSENAIELTDTPALPVSRTVPLLGSARKREIPTVSTAGLDLSQPGASRAALTPPPRQAIVRAAAIERAWYRPCSDIVHRYVVGSAGVAAAGFHRMLQGAWRPGLWYWARAADLAAAANISPNSATSYLRDLVAAGVLDVRHHGRRGLELRVVLDEDEIRGLAESAAWERGIKAVQRSVIGRRDAPQQTSLTEQEGEGGEATQDDSNVAEFEPTASEFTKLDPVNSQNLGALTGELTIGSTGGCGAGVRKASPPKGPGRHHRPKSQADIGQEHLVLAVDQHALLAILEANGVATRLPDGRELTASYLRAAAGLSPEQLAEILRGGAVSAPWDLIIRRRHWATAKQQGGLMGLDLRSLRDPDCEAVLGRIPDLRWSSHLTEAVEQLASRGLLLTELEEWVGWMSAERHRWAGQRMAFWSDLRRWLLVWEGERAAERERRQQAARSRLEAQRRQDEELAALEAKQAASIAGAQQEAQRRVLEAQALPEWTVIRAAAGQSVLREDRSSSSSISTWWDAKSVLGLVEGDALVVAVSSSLFLYTLRDRAMAMRPVYATALEKVTALGHPVQRLVVRVGTDRSTDVTVFAMEALVTL